MTYHYVRRAGAKTKQDGREMEQSIQETWNIILEIAFVNNSVVVVESYL